MNPYGYNLTFGQDAWKCASLTTEAQPDGTYGFYMHQLAGPGVQRHLHAYAEVNAEGVIVRGGAKLKENVGSHLGSGILLSHSTQEIARFRVQAQAGGVSCQLSQWVDGAWLVTSESTYGRAISRRPVSLPGSQAVSAAEYSLAMFDARSYSPSGSTGMILLPFAAPLPFGVAVTLLQTW